MRTAPVAKAEMLIRRPVAEVFEAFVDPAVTRKFWFTNSTGRLEAGRKVRWDWEMYGVSADVDVKAIDKDARILVDWGLGGDMTRVEWTFTPQPYGATFVGIANSGFRGDDDDMVMHAIGSTEGFTLVLAALKALLEHDIRLNLVADRFPNGVLGVENPG